MFQLKSKSTNSLNHDNIQPNLIKSVDNFSSNLEKYNNLNLSIESVDSIDSVERRDSAISDITVNDSKDNLGKVSVVTDTPKLVPTDSHTTTSDEVSSDDNHNTKFSAGIKFIQQFNSKCKHYNDNILIINMHQLIELLNFYYSNALESSDKMFPFLHGLDNSRQRIFFNKHFKNLNNDYFNITDFKHLDEFTLPILEQLHLMILNTDQDENNSKLINSIKFHDVFEPMDCSPKTSPMSNFKKSTTTLHQTDGELNNRNFKHQLKIYSKISNFIIYNNSCNFQKNLKSAMEINQLNKTIYIVDFNQKYWKCLPFEYLNNYNFKMIDNLPISSINNQAFNCKLLKWEQNLLWKFNSMKWFNKHICLGNLIDFNYINNINHDFKLIINCNEYGKIPKIISNYIEFPSSGYLNFDHISLNELINYLNLLKTIELLVSNNQQIFIFSFDGFTGLTLLTLSIGLMLNNKSLEQLLLDIYHQDDYLKFYYFKNDLMFLKKFEKFIKYSKTFPIGEKLNFINYNNLPTISNKNITDWFNYSKDNNFPCKIFKNLYLGSLNHANSKTVINTMKFNKIVSIGEQPHWINLNGLKSVYSYYNESNELIEIFDIKLNLPELPHLKLCIFIKNLKDDGKDGIIKLLLDIPKHIQSKYLINPNDSIKTLYHCKIGVSRSASLVISSLMKFQKISLLESYMIVRINRFNIIIQPNLKIMYDLYLFDDYLNIKHGTKRLYTWYTLCNEIYKLNRNYIE